MIMISPFHHSVSFSVLLFFCPLPITLLLLLNFIFPFLFHRSHPHTHTDKHKQWTYTVFPPLPSVFIPLFMLTSPSLNRKGASAICHNDKVTLFFFSTCLLLTSSHPLISHDTMQHWKDKELCSPSFFVLSLTHRGKEDMGRSLGRT